MKINNHNKAFFYKIVLLIVSSSSQALIFFYSRTLNYKAHKIEDQDPYDPYVPNGYSPSFNFHSIFSKILDIISIMIFLFIYLYINEKINKNLKASAVNLDSNKSFITVFLLTSTILSLLIVYVAVKDLPFDLLYISYKLFLSILPPLFIYKVYLNKENELN